MAEPKIDYQMESGNAHRVEPRVDPGGFLARPTGDPDRSERAFHVPAEQMGVQLAVALVGTSYLKVFNVPFCFLIEPLDFRPTRALARVFTSALTQTSSCALCRESAGFPEELRQRVR